MQIIRFACTTSNWKRGKEESEERGVTEEVKEEVVGRERGRGMHTGTVLTLSTIVEWLTRSVFQAVKVLHEAVGSAGSTLYTLHPPLHISLSLSAIHLASRNIFRDAWVAATAAEAVAAAVKVFAFAWPKSRCNFKFVQVENQAKAKSASYRGGGEVEGGECHVAMWPPGLCEVLRFWPAGPNSYNYNGCKTAKQQQTLLLLASICVSRHASFPAPFATSSLSLFGSFAVFTQLFLCSSPSNFFSPMSFSALSKI